MRTSQLLAITATALLLGTGCESSPSTARVARATGAQPLAHAYPVTARSCVGSWHAPAAGDQSFEVANTGDQTLQVTLINAESGAIFGSLAQLDPGTARPIAVDAPAGRYRFRCIPRHGVASVSAVERISGSGGSAATSISPLSPQEIVTAVSVYRHGVVCGVRRLVRQTDLLRQDVRRHKPAAAERAWLAAHLTFASLGAAYGTFGELSDKIDGRDSGLALGVNDPGFTGFLKIEALLWHRSSQASLGTAVSALDAEVHTLQKRLPNLKLLAGDLPLRAHEILENALQFELTGDTDEGSHTNLSTVLANVRGTQLVLRALTPAIQQRRPALATVISADLINLATGLRSVIGHDRFGPQIASLPLTTREHLDADLDGVLEQLAILPGLLQLPTSLALP